MGRENSFIFKNGGNQYIGEILANEYLYIGIHLPKCLFLPEHHQNRKYNEMRCDLTVSYSDMFDYSKYQYNLHLVFKITIIDIINEAPYFYKEGYIFANVDYCLNEILPRKNIYSIKEKKYIHEIFGNGSTMNKRKTDQKKFM